MEQTTLNNTSSHAKAKTGQLPSNALWQVRLLWAIRSCCVPLLGLWRIMAVHADAGCELGGQQEEGCRERQSEKFSEMLNCHHSSSSVAERTLATCLAQITDDKIRQCMFKTIIGMFCFNDA